MSSHLPVLYRMRFFRKLDPSPHPDAFHGLFTRRMCEINAADSRKHSIWHLWEDGALMQYSLHVYKAKCVDFLPESSGFFY